MALVDDVGGGDMVQAFRRTCARHPLDAGRGRIMDNLEDLRGLGGGGGDVGGGCGDRVVDGEVDCRLEAEDGGRVVDLLDHGGRSRGSGDMDEIVVAVREGLADGRG